MTTNREQPPAAPLAYATPDPVTRNRTREVVFATVTFLIGLAMCLGAAAILLGIFLALVSSPPGAELLLLLVPLLFATALGYAGPCVVRASLAIIRRPAGQVDRLMNSGADLTPAGCAVLIVTVPVLTAACAVLIISLISLGRWVSTGFAGDVWALGLVLGGCFAAIAGCVLVLRLRV